MTSPSPPLLPYFEIRSADGDGGAGFASVIDTLDPLYDCHFDRTFEDSVDIALQTYLMGPLIFGRTAGRRKGETNGTGGLDFAYSRNNRKIAETTLDVIVIDVVIDGGDVGLSDDNDDVARPGDIFIQDMTRPFHIQTRAHASLHLAIPRNLFQRSDTDMATLHGKIIRGQSVPGALIRSHLSTLWDRAYDIRPEDAGGVARSTLDLVTGLSLPSAARPEETEAIAGACVFTLKRFIDRHLASSDLGPVLLCQQFGLSRAALYRLFAPLGGVADHIRGRRLRRVCDDLANPVHLHRNISEIAYGWGFNDLSAFARAFKVEFGMTPREVRDLASAPSHWRQDGKTLPAGAHAFPQWLQQLDGL